LSFAEKTWSVLVALNTMIMMHPTVLKSTARLGTAAILHERPHTIQSLYTSVTSMVTAARAYVAKRMTLITAEGS
jgi:hypothetical protein